MLVKGFLLTNYPESLSMYTDHSIVHKQLKTPNSMEVKETEMETVIDPAAALVEKVKSLTAFSIRGVMKQRENCFSFMRNLVNEGLIDEADVAIIVSFQCDEGEAGTLNTEYLCEVHTDELTKTRPGRGIRFGHLRDAMLFTEELNTRSLVKQDKDLKEPIFLFWGSKTRLKGPDGFLKDFVICVSIEDGKPMLYPCPTSELFEGDYKDRPKMSIMAQVSYY